MASIRSSSTSRQKAMGSETGGVQMLHEHLHGAEAPARFYMNHAVLASRC
jgi:hypothetical protein